MSDEFKIDVPEILETLTPKEKVFCMPGLTAKQTRMIQHFWDRCMDDDMPNDERFFQAFILGNKIGRDRAIEQIDEVFREMRTKPAND
jgi:hypothetical protein